MMSFPAHKNVTHPAGQWRNPQTLGDTIAHIDPATGDTRKPPLLAADEVVRKLLVATENLERARKRRASADQVDLPAAAENLLGCLHNMASARMLAEEFLRQAPAPQPMPHFERAA